MLGGDDQAEPFLGERDEGQAVGAGGGLARHAGLRQAGRHRGRDLQVARPPGCRSLAGRRRRGRGAARSASSRRRASAPGSRLTIRSRCLAMASRPVTAALSSGRTARPSRQAVKPTTSAPSGSGWPASPPSPWVCTPADVHQALAREPERRGGATGPPGEGDRRVEQGERGGEQRERRVAARHDERRAGRAYRADRDQLKSGVGPVSAARGAVIRGTGRDRGDGDVRRIGEPARRQEAKARRPRRRAAAAPRTGRPPGRAPPGRSCRAAGRR